VERQELGHTKKNDCERVVRELSTLILKKDLFGAETVSYDDLLVLQYQKAKEGWQSPFRRKRYLVKDGDILSGLDYV